MNEARGKEEERAVPEAHLTELFSSFQGEGVHVGRRQIFVRFYGCHRNCDYCDTPGSVSARQGSGYRPVTFPVALAAVGDEMRRGTNPVTPHSLAHEIDRLDREAGPHHSVALTGGEPLLHDRFLGAFLPLLKVAGRVIYLETTGDLPARFEKVARWIDIAAIDIKLPGATGEVSRWEAHGDFLERAGASGAEIFVKAVAGAKSTLEELEKAAFVVAEVSPSIPFILQPLTPFEGRGEAPSPAQLSRWQARLSRILDDVRVIPQAHKAVGVR